MFIRCLPKPHRVWFSRSGYLLLLAFGWLPIAFAQNEAIAPDKTDPATAQAPATPQTSPGSEAGSSSTEPVIGPGDELDVIVWRAPDLAQHTRVSSAGEIYMPLLGYVHIAGLTSEEAQALIEKRLMDGHFLQSPYVTIYVKDYASAGISVAGEVNKPGVYSALGRHQLLDIFQAAGGLTEKAGKVVTIAHRDHPNDVVSLTLSSDPAEMAQRNLELLPGDSVMVSKAGIVYVLGEVNKPGGFVMNESGGTTVLRVIAAAGGPSQLASLGGTKMLRRTPDGLKEIPVPLKKILRAKAPDVPLQPEDILYVPSSSAKRIVNASALLTTIGTASIYRIP
jgi:polysaccharide export outer membrane protein